MSASRAARVGVLLALVLAIFAARLHTFDEPFEADIATYAVIGHEMASGRALYSDLWDHKPPGIFATYAAAQRLFGYDPSAVFALGVAAALLTLAGVYRATTVLTGRAAAGLWAAAFWTAICSSLALQANQPNTEVFINAALVWAFAMLLALRDDSFDWPRTLAIGALFAAATFYKHTSVVAAAAFALVHVLRPAGPGGRGRAIAQVAVMAGVGATAWLAVALHFAIDGRFADLWSAVVVEASGFAGGLSGNLGEAASLKRLMPRFLRAAIPLFTLAFVGAALGDWRRPSRGFLLLAAWWLATIPSIALPGRFYPHYYQLWLPPICIGGAAALASLSRVAPRPAAAHAVGAAVLALLLAMELPSYRLSADEWSQRKYGPDFLATRQVGRALGRFLPRDETFYNWGDQPGLYYYSGRRPPTGVLWRRHLLDGPLIDTRSARVVRDLERTLPELVVEHPKQRPHPEHPVVKWFRARYELIPNGLPEGSFRLYYRRGGALEARLRAAGRLAS